MMRHWLGAALVGATVTFSGFSATAQDFPNQSVRIVVTASAGGGTDQIARLFASKLQDAWGQSVVVENKLGGGGNIGAQFVARAKPDGYTLLVSFGGVITINPYLYKELGFDPIKDLSPVTLLATAPYVLVTNPEKVPSKTVEEFVAHLKANQGKLSWASFAKGSPDHLAGELFQQMTGTKMTHIPYKGGAEAILDVLGGRVEAGFFTIPTALPHVQTGKLRALGASDVRPVSLLPDVPAIAASGLPGYEVLTWYGVWAPAGTPKAVLDKIHADLGKVLASEDVSKRLRDTGFDAKGIGSADFAAFIANESKKYGAIIDAAGLQKN